MVFMVFTLLPQYINVLFATYTVFSTGKHCTMHTMCWQAKVYLAFKISPSLCWSTNHNHVCSTTFSKLTFTYIYTCIHYNWSNTEWAKIIALVYHYFGTHEHVVSYTNISTIIHTIASTADWQVMCMFKAMQKNQSCNKWSLEEQEFNMLYEVLTFKWSKVHAHHWWYILCHYSWHMSHTFSERHPFVVQGLFTTKIATAIQT